MANVKTRNVSLTPQIDAFIDDRVNSGRFRSASEVVRAALRLLEEDERRREAPDQRVILNDRSAKSRDRLQE
jgi:antitoxin ParD1/3/4